MNRCIDSRSDLYSLGCLFYYLLNDKILPYHDSNDYTDIIHSHIARPKPTLTHITLAADNKQNKQKDNNNIENTNDNSSSNSIRVLIPKLLNDILDKLLEKTPESRYQSALGLKQDLLFFKEIYGQNISSQNDLNNSLFSAKTYELGIMMYLHVYLHIIIVTILNISIPYVMILEQ